MPLLVISCSLNTSSRSRELARVTKEHFSHEKEECLFIDLAEFDLPFCDGDKAYEHPHVKQLAKAIDQATAIIMAVPIYNFAAGAAARNLVELVGNSFEQKVVGFICAAGGQRSYMSVMDLANSLMLHHHCLIIPQFVYVDGSSFSENGRLESPDIHARLHLLLEMAVRLKNALR
jgi:NAD(P)H-dependent FMN reductase